MSKNSRPCSVRVIRSPSSRNLSHCLYSLMKLHPLEFEKPIIELQEKLADLKQHSRAQDINFDSEVRRMETKIEETKRQIYQNLTAWERVQIARHPARPYSL